MNTERERLETSLRQLCEMCESPTPIQAIVFVRDLKAERDALAELRPEVLAFARLMEKKLRANEHKGGWKNDSAPSLCRRIFDEARELQAVLECETCNLNAELVGDEAADVANFAMMVADVCGALESAK